MGRTVPSSAGHVVIGAGVHGLSTAWHLARLGEDVLVVDKTGVAAGASGIACGVVRNNYFQPAMGELMAACVEVWESDARRPALPRHRLSRARAAGAGVRPGRRSSSVSSASATRRSCIVGEAEVAEHMRGIYPDWRAQGLSVCLHEHAGGFAFNRESMMGLAGLARAAGAQIVEGVEVTGFEGDADGAVDAVLTSAGRIEVTGDVVVAVGPWIPALWEHARPAGARAGRRRASARCGPTGTSRRARSR